VSFRICISPIDDLHQPIETTTTNRRHSPIRSLNGDVLLNIFYLYRLDFPVEYENCDGELYFYWDHQRWWYKLAHVCRLWRNLILASPSRLDLNLLCTYGVPVADMLAFSPLLPLTIYYEGGDRRITAEDESGILLALSHRERVRHISFCVPPVGHTNVLSKFVMAMDDQFPILECLYIDSQTEEVLPVAFQAPNLRHLLLSTTSPSIRSTLLTTIASLVSLALTNIPASAYFPPGYLLTQLSFMLQLETFVIGFHSPLPNRDVERQLFHATDIPQITLPNLCWFAFQGTSAYFEGLVARISAPSLSVLEVYLFNQLTFTVPCLSQFLLASENLRFNAVKVVFNGDFVHFKAAHSKEIPPLQLQIKCGHLDWQVASVVQIFTTLSPVLSAVDEVTLSYVEHNQSSEWHNDISQTQWRELLRPFSNAKTLRVQDELIDQISRSLQSNDGELPLGLLANLKGVEYSGRSHAQGSAFTAFLNERHVAGQPVSLSLVDPSLFLDDEE
jgi:hypothetical protein